MLHKIKILVIMFIVLSCSSANQIKLNTKVSSENRDNNKILLPSGALVFSTLVIEKSIKYSIGISSDNEIIFISTTDDKFKVKGFKVNDYLPQEYFNENKIKHIPGWGYYVDLGDGWFAGFDFNRKPGADSKIGWFFKYNF